MKKKKKTKKRKVLKYHSLLSAVFLSAYLSVGLIGGKQLLLSDIQQKGEVAGAMVSAVVRALGPPISPIVSFSSDCSAERNPFVSLQWPADENAASFDIYRNEMELMLGMNENAYTDYYVSGGTNYTYYVIARGLIGVATSESVSVLTDSCAAIADPIVRVNAFEGDIVENLDDIPSTAGKKPVFSGTTNIPNAIVELEVHSREIIYATVHANENGFWQWSPPVKLSEGTHILYITAMDPVNPAIVSASSFVFKIKDEEDDEDNNKKKKNSSSLSGTNPSGSPVAISQNKIVEETREATEKPIDFDVILDGESYIKGVNINKEAYRGENLEVIITFTDVISENEPINLSYAVISAEQKVVAEYSDIISPKNGETISKKIPLSYKLDLGRYKLQINAAIGNTTVSHENYFILKDKPILEIGTGVVITYRDILNNLSWLVISSFVILIIIGILAGREHHLYRRAMFHITGKILRKKGFIN